MTQALRSFAESNRLQAQLHRLVPGGAHTYARGDDQYPEEMAPIIARGAGARVWDVDGNEFVEYGMGLRSVTLGHGYRPVVEAACAAIADGMNFSRPTELEVRGRGGLPGAGPDGRHGEVRQERLRRHDGGGPARPRGAPAGTRSRSAITPSSPSTTGSSAAPRCPAESLPTCAKIAAVHLQRRSTRSAALFAAHPDEICGVILEAGDRDRRTGDRFPRGGARTVRPARLHC